MFKKKTRKRISIASTWHAKGHTTEYGKKQIAVRVSETLFSQLKAQAIKDKTSMQAKIEDYIRVGLIVDGEDWDEEPNRAVANQ